jgi:hypothetical protein
MGCGHLTGKDTTKGECSCEDKPDMEADTCEECFGEGMVGIDNTLVPCPSCKGTGKEKP